MAYVDSAALAADKTFQSRVEMAMLNYTTVVEGEASNTAGHAQRHDIAVNVVRSPQNYVEAMTLLICGFNAALTLTATDVDLNNSIAACWNLFAGV